MNFLVRTLDIALDLYRAFVQGILHVHMLHDMRCWAADVNDMTLRGETPSRAVQCTVNCPFFILHSSGRQSEFDFTSAAEVEIRPGVL